MKRRLAVLLIAALILPGCAAKPAVRTLTTLPPDEPRQAAAGTPADIWRQFAQKLPVGTLVRVSTLDGARFTGTLLIVDDQALTVNPRTRIPEPARRLAFDHIAQLEPTSDSATQLAKAVAIGAGVGGATFLGLLVLLATSWD